jgi:uncharacterized protein (TIGR00255 family)
VLVSMTGHGQASIVSETLDVHVEVRTINNRFFKCSLNNDLPADVQAKVEDCIRKRVSRGTVYVRLRLHQHADLASYRLNGAAVQAYQLELQRLGLPPASSDALLTLPGVIVEQENYQGDEALWPAIEQAVMQALDQLDAMRRQEGAAMAENLLANLEQLDGCTLQIERLGPSIVDHFSQRLTERINTLLQKHNISGNPADVIREVGAYAERADVAEEIVRLRSHCELFRATMKSPDSNGRKLDFVVQEMLRETNTIGSKCGAADVANLVVEMKTVIERMREMVQNIE